MNVAAESSGTSAKRPNFLIILADDMGYSDIGCFGSEISTPNIDRLAKEGLRFNDYHTASLCSPTRSMIMSGTDCHLAGVGVMYEHRAAADLSRWNKPGHEGYLNHDVAALPEVLQDSGYHTLMSGKWHLGYKEGHIPAHRGFDRSFSLLPGSSNHFGWEPVFENGEAGRPRLPGMLPMLYCDEDKRYLPTPNHASDPSTGFYTSTTFTTRLLDYLKDRQSSSVNSQKPFFGYLAFSAPHWPLQCSKEDRVKYKGMYDDGPLALRLKRLERLKAAGIVSPDVRPHDVVKMKSKEWDELTPDEKKMSSRSMEVYAGMVTALDREVGRVIEYLEETGELDNTFIMFCSDNGAEGAAMEANPTMGPRLLAAIDKWFDNSYDNLGNANSYVWYGPQWAQAASAPHRLFKGMTTEGGIRVPLVLRYPEFNAFQSNSIVPAFTTCMDIMPTMLNLAGITHPNATPESPTSKVSYRGHEVYPMRGKSWVSLLRDRQSAAGADTESGRDAVYGDAAVGWEMHAKAGLRKGKWKIVNLPVNSYGTGGWQLYDMSTDRGETEDLATVYPDILKDMLREWGRYTEETGAVFGPPLRSAEGDQPPLNVADVIGGDPTEDIRAWMRVGQGKRLGEVTEPRPDVEAWAGISENNNGVLDSSKAVKAQA